MESEGWVLKSQYESLKKLNDANYKSWQEKAEEISRLTARVKELEDEVKTLDLSKWGVGFRELVSDAKKKAGYWKEDNRTNRENVEYLTKVVKDKDALLTEAGEVLNKMEWTSSDFETRATYCPLCDNDYADTHMKDCRLAALLAKI